MRLIILSLTFSLLCGPGYLASAAAPTRNIPLPRPRPPEAEQAQPSEPPEAAGPSQCFVDLTSSGVAIAESLSRLEARRGCGAEDALRLNAVVLDDARQVEFKPAPVLRCTMATELAKWVRQDLAAQVLPLGAPLAEIENYDSYECRPRNRVAGAQISEHGRANAIDIRSVTLTNGKRYELTDPYVKKAVRDQLKASACARFVTVLGPGSDGYHEQHIHLDLAENQNGYRLCHWDVNLPIPLPRPRPANAPQADESVVSHQQSE
ncbi:MAG: extensin family protein [Xanthobacteraceae bacterium]|nr:extensin family protein [Xanthobacteraceae bacterium]MBV9627756.1 extensin family protein [Xanthobacteraceae bacterium]